MTFDKVINGFTTRGLRVEDVRRYLDGGGDINHQDAKMSWSLLHFAAEDGNDEVIRLLARQGANLNLKDRNGWTPLHVAVDSDLDSSRRGVRPGAGLPTVQALMDAGADESAKAADGATPGDIAASYGQQALYDLLVRPSAV